jgi:hypothetical protein
VVDALADANEPIEPANQGGSIRRFHFVSTFDRLSVSNTLMITAFGQET